MKSRAPMIGRFCVAIGIVAVFALVVWLADPFLLSLFGVLGLMWIGFPSAIVGVVLLSVAVHSGRSRRPAYIVLAGVATFTLLVGLAIPSNRFIQENAVADAKAFPTRVASELEAYRQAHGAYPISLDELPKKPPVPRLLRTTYGYRSDGNSYSFCFAQPGGMINTWDYDSETHSWHLST